MLVSDHVALTAIGPTAAGTILKTIQLIAVIIGQLFSLFDGPGGINPDPALLDFAFAIGIATVIQVTGQIP